MTKDTDRTERPHGRVWLRAAVRLTVYAGLGCLLAGVAVGLVVFIAYAHATRPGIPGPLIEIAIPRGAPGAATGRILAETGLVEHEWLFRLAMRLDTSGRVVKYGRYALPSGLSPVELRDLLYEGPNVAPGPEEIPEDCKVTVPEGLTIAQIARLFSNPEAFIDAASNPELIARLGIDASTLEGFLMPDTYFFAEKPTEAEVVERMVGQFEKTYAGLRNESPGAERSMMDVVTVASLVEEEARVDDERPQIAAVIYNRLARNRPLELDCTLQYALGKYGRRMLYQDKETDSPYNTYKYPGLPPGPISNPGKASLRAALGPADVDYLYFVSNADGKTHTFSSTIQAHTKAVARYRREAAAQRRRLRQQGLPAQETSANHGPADLPPDQDGVTRAD